MSPKRLERFPLHCEAKAFSFAMQPPITDDGGELARRAKKAAKPKILTRTYLKIAKRSRSAINVG